VLEQDRYGLVVTVPAAVWGPDGFLRERGWPRLERLCARGGGAL
jgi:pilus assembly protein CpaF